MMQVKKIIGTRTYMTFMGDSDQRVPAKVDTGADFSSVWASNIEERSDGLHFTLFAPNSPYYTGKVHSTRQYSITEVRNSFGHTEKRYKTKLSVKIKGRRVRATFNLSDRSRNRYPILIGKKTLGGKFLVDSSLKPRDIGSLEVKVLMLNSQPSASIEEFSNKLSKATKNLSTDFATYDDLALCFLKDGPKIISLNSGKELPHYDMVYFKTHQKRQEFAAAMATILDMTNVQYIDREIENACANSKITQYARLYAQNLSVPATVALTTKNTQGKYKLLKRLVGLPFILKDPEADKGLRNYIIRSEEEYTAAIEATSDKQLYFVAQQFIPNEGDLRVIVLDKAVQMVIGRRVPEGVSTHLNNTSTGGTATLLPLDELAAPEKALAVHAALVLNRQVAGVDLMQDTETKKWYVLEVNNSPQLAEGAFVEEKIQLFAKFLKKYADK